MQTSSYTARLENYLTAIEAMHIMNTWLIQRTTKPALSYPWASVVITGQYITFMPDEANDLQISGDKNR